VEVWYTSNLRPLRLGEEKKIEEEEEEERNYRAKNVMARLLHRAAIMNSVLFYSGNNCVS